MALGDEAAMIQTGTVSRGAQKWWEPLFAGVRARVLRYATSIFESPVQVVVFLIGAWFTANGVIAYGIYPDMAFGGHMQSCTMRFLGFIPVTVNGWHALFHLLTGMAALALAPFRNRAVGYLYACGPFYLLVAALGFIGGDNVLHMMAVDTFGSIVHAVEAVIMLAAGTLATLGERRSFPGTTTVTS
ncbi:DUF4383 domain-containing protein [Nocardia concava]|uniref:DUF4383 domain-containing protein n=1 Tax=Nocardia concava TaxID=257281 RepID=UPI0002FDE55C|nr:DUF4383 domain-containing protein [Nocardia concava]